MIIVIYVFTFLCAYNLPSSTKLLALWVAGILLVLFIGYQQCLTHFLILGQWCLLNEKNDIISVKSVHGKKRGSP